MAEDEPPRIVATFDSYAGMLARVNELQVSGERLDEYVGLPRGYYSKVAGAKPIRRLGMTSLAPIMNGLGLTCPFLPLLFSRIVNARLRAFAANVFEPSHCENDAWRATHVTRIPRRQAIFQTFCRLLVFNELAL